jgi:hypothetical protein
MLNVIILNVIMLSVVTPILTLELNITSLWPYHCATTIGKHDNIASFLAFTESLVIGNYGYIGAKILQRPMLQPVCGLYYKYFTILIYNQEGTLQFAAYLKILIDAKLALALARSLNPDSFIEQAIGITIVIYDCKLRS